MAKTLIATFSTGIIAMIVLCNWPWPVEKPAMPAMSASRPIVAVKPIPVRPDYLNHTQEAAVYVQKLAEQSHGDYKKLSADDQHYLDHITDRHGPQMLRRIMQDLKARRAKAAAARSTSRRSTSRT